MANETGWRYGADGFPYLVGFGATMIGSTIFGCARLRRRGAADRLVLGTVAVGVAASVPTFLGLRYVTRGKIALRDRMLDSIQWRGDEQVADLGAGRGLLGIGAARRTQGTVHCVDLFIAKDLLGNSPDRLMINARRVGVAEQVEIRREDVKSVGLGDASVDVVLSALCLHNLNDAHDRAAALSEAIRIVKPRGTIVISDLAHVDDEYAPVLKQAGFEVRIDAPVRNTFPPQRLLVALAPA